MFDLSKIKQSYSPRRLSFQRIFSSYSFNLLKSYLGLQLISQVNSLVSLFFIAKYLGPANLGVMSYAQYLASMTVFINSGIDTWSTYEMMRSSHDEEKVKSIFSKVSRAKIIITIIAVAIIVPITIIKSDNSFELAMYICAILISSVSVTFFTQYNAYALANRLLPSVNRGALIISLLILISRLLAVYYSAPAILFLIIMLLEPIFIFSLFILNNFKLLNSRGLFEQIYKILKLVSAPSLKIETNKLLSHSNFIKNKVKQEIRNAFSIIYQAKYYLGIYIFSLLASRTDLLMLKFYVDNHDLGIYSAAMRLAEYPVIISGIIGNVLVIHLALSVRSRVRYTSIVLGYISDISAALLFILIFNLGGHYITHLIYGSRFQGVESILSIYSYGLLGIFITNFSALIFMTHKKEYYILYSSIFGAVVLYLLCKLFIPSYGLYGAALSSTITYTLVGILSIAIAFILEHKHKKDNEITLV